MNIFPGYAPKPVDYNAPVEKWAHERNDINHLSLQVDGRKLLQQTSFSSNEQDLLQSLLIEVFYRRSARTFAKCLSVMCRYDPSFAQSALVEASRQGQSALLKYALPVAYMHNHTGAMIVASLLGNHLETAHWIIHNTPVAFQMSLVDLNDLAKKSPHKRLEILTVCVQHGDVDQILSKIEAGPPRLKDMLGADWIAAKYKVLTEDGCRHRRAQPRKM